MSASRGDVQTIVAARHLADAESVFIGVGRPSTAAILARAIINPDLVLVYESGTIGAKPTRIPLSIGDGELAATADFVVSVPEMFNYWIQPGRVDVAFLGAAQVDPRGALNSTVIGDYDAPEDAPAGRGRRAGDRARLPPGDGRRAALQAHVRGEAGLRDDADRAGRGDHRPRRAGAAEAHDGELVADAGPPRRDRRRGARGDRLGAARRRRPARRPTRRPTRS